MKKLLMRKIFLLLMIASATWLSSCKDQLEIYHIERLGFLSFSTDNLNTQIATDVKYYQGKTTLYYYSAAKSELLTRYLLDVKGTNSSGKNYTLNIEFDVIPTKSFIGIYRTEYQETIGGIHSFTYLEEVSPKIFKSYNLDPDFLKEDFVRVKLQNTQEKLILGDFFAKLRNDQDPADKIVFYQGTFKDISYELQ
jgi:hypothetical protein